MSDWKLDDKEWVKQRKRDWREVKFNINAFSEGWMNIDKEQQKQVEKYFLTGDLDARNSLYEMCDSLLIELWIYPSDDIEVLKQVFNRHCQAKADYKHVPPINTPSEKRAFKPLTIYSELVKYKGETRLNGRDNIIDQVFMPQTLEDELKLFSQDEQNDIIEIGFLSYCNRFEEFFERTVHLDYDICQYKVKYWADSLKLAFAEFGHKPRFKRLIKMLDQVNAAPENYLPIHLKLAEEINTILAEPEIAEIVGEKVAEIRANT